MTKARTSLAALAVTASMGAPAVATVAVSTHASPQPQVRQVVVRSSWSSPQTVIIVRSSWSGPQSKTA